MKEILVINPKKQKKHAKKRAKKKAVKSVATKITTKGVKTMAKPKKRPHKKAPRHNPSAASISSRARGAIFGLRFRDALAGILPTQAGMWATKWAAKRLSDEYTADITDPASWSTGSVVKGALGGVAAAIALNIVKPGLGQKALEGSLNLLTFLVLRNKVIEGNEWATNQFGEQDKNFLQDQNYLPESAEDIVYDGADGPVFLGEDGSWYPADDRHRLGAGLEPVGPLGATLEPVSHLGEADPYQKAWRRA